jgi:hypothetical protein
VRCAARRVCRGGDDEAARRQSAGRRAGTHLPNDLAREAWSFLTPYLGEADAYVFSREAFTWEGLDHARVSVISPSIDAFSPKNHAMAFSSVTAVLRAAGLAAGEHERHGAVFERLDGSVGFV